MPARRIARQPAGETPSVVPVGLAVGLGKSAVSPPPLMERAVDQEAERARAEEPEEPEAKRPRRSAAARACTQNKPVSYTGTASSEQAPALSCRHHSRGQNGAKPSTSSH